MSATRSTGPHTTWAKRFEGVAMLLALIFLAAYAIPILDPDAPAAVRDACRIAVWVTWVLLALEVAARFVHAESKRIFFRHHWLDVAAVILPVLRPLRLLRLVLLVSFLQRHVGHPVTTEGRCIAVALMVVGVALLGVVTASLATWLIEQVREIEEESDALQRQDIIALRDEVTRLRLELENRSLAEG